MFNIIRTGECHCQLFTTAIYILHICSIHRFRFCISLDGRMVVVLAATVVGRFGYIWTYQTFYFPMDCCLMLLMQLKLYFT